LHVFVRRRSKKIIMKQSNTSHVHFVNLTCLIMVSVSDIPVETVLIHITYTIAFHLVHLVNWPIGMDQDLGISLNSLVKLDVSLWSLI
jgi:hypothetical protein